MAQYPYYLHQDIFDPNTTPWEGIYWHLLQQSQYPELFNLSKRLSRGYDVEENYSSTLANRPYMDMEWVYGIRDSRSDWVTRYYEYPTLFTKASTSLWDWYQSSLRKPPDDYEGNYYYDPKKIKRFIGILAHQRMFVHQFLNAYISRTRTHHEVMYNRAQDEEQYDALVDSVWGVAKGMWKRANAAD